MTIYFINFIINMLIGIFIKYRILRNYPKLGDKIYLVITLIQIATLPAIRSIDVGYDTYSYNVIFNMAPYAFSEVLEKCPPFIELGFFTLCTTIKALGGDFQVLLIVTSYFIIGSSLVFIHRHSNNVLFSVFLLISFPFYYSSFDIIRHFIAIGIILLGFKYVLNRNLYKYLLTIVVAYQFHRIAILFIPLYFINRVKLNYFKCTLFLIITVLLTYNVDIAMKFFSIFIGGSGYIGSWIGSYGGGLRTSLMYCLIFIISYLAYNNLIKKEELDDIALTFVFLLFLFSILFINARMATRLIMSFIPFLSVSLPRLLCKDNNIKSVDSVRRFILLIIIIGLIYHYFMLNMNWQNVVPFNAFWRI